jgi:oligoribonuclease
MGISVSAIRAEPYPSPNLGDVLVWMDLEMTGLDPAKNVIVEIATLVTDDDLNIVAEGPDLVVHATEEQLAVMEPVVVDMHTKSGLLDQIRASTITLEDAGAQTLAFIQQHVSQPRSVPLCGNSIGMDRRFLDAYLPEIEQYLHYRSVDVSSVKELVRRWYPQVLNSIRNKQGTHRALDDIRESVIELRHYREHVFVPVATPEAAVQPTPGTTDTAAN